MKVNQVKQFVSSNISRFEKNGSSACRSFNLYDKNNLFRGEYNFIPLDRSGYLGVQTSLSNTRIMDDNRRLQMQEYVFMNKDYVTLKDNSSETLTKALPKIITTTRTIMDFVKDATALRRGVGKEYLVYGKMIKPRPVACETVAMYKPGTGYRNDYPVVLSTAWQAPDGKVAQILASYRKQEETCTLDLRNTNGATLLNHNGEALATLPAELCEITIPAHTVRMVSFN